ncbi:MAG TPA: PAS domain S-box protein [Myxococcota bacterium]|nr:PAS domain S-box protein [Myxococcota bacterium]HRY95209.1 PAS domain S-box protein [Myxococcota bacterium]HSA20522.1 PAS domain S-box protein [Myxococcota bacterium]
MGTEREGEADGPGGVGLDARLQTVLTNPMVVVYSLDEAGRFVYASQSVRALIGRPPEELLGRPFQELIHPDDLPHIQRRFEALGRGQLTSDEYRVLHGSGEPRWVLSYSQPVLEGGRFSGITGVALDIHARKLAEEARRRSEERFRNLAELLPEAIYEADPRGRLLYANRAAFETFGYAPEDLGRGLTVLDMLVPADRDRALERFAEVLAGRRAVGSEYVARRKDGSTFPVMLRSVAIVDDGRLVGVRGLVIDLSEKARLEAQLRQAQKMEALGQLAGGVAHDVNNLLTPILGYADLLLMDPPADPARRDWLEEIRRAAVRARDLVVRLLAFSRKQVLEMQPVELGGLVAGLEGMLRRTIREDVELRFERPEAPLWVLADPTQLELALLSLVVNAQDAMPRGGTVGVTLSAPPQVAGFAGPAVRLQVSDTGVGMDAEVRNHLFEPFFTTKPLGKGTGLGLASVYGIVQKHGGAISVESAVGAGARLTLDLPRIAAPAPPVDGAPEEGGGPALTGRVLVVEDEATVRSLAREILEQLGFQVLVAASGEEAVALVSGLDGPLALVLTDMVMPEMSGRELLGRLRELRPGLAAVFMSGYSAEEEVQPGEPGKTIPFLSKPFTARMLEQRVRLALADGVAPTPPDKR